MTMKIKVATYLGLLFYLSIVASISVVSDFDLWVTIILFFGLPSIWLLWLLRPPVSLFLPVAISALATTLLFESIAYSSGLWYELSDFQVRMFGVFPLEIFFWNFATQLLIIAVHEYFSDDRLINEVRINWKNIWLLGFLVLLAVIGVLFVTTMSRVVLPFAAWWLLAGAVVSLGGAMILSHTSSRAVIKKAGLTTLLMLPILLIHELVSLFSFHWVFANPAQYLASINIAGELYPVERFLFILLIPLWIIVVYESYLDDSA